MADVVGEMTSVIDRARDRLVWKFTRPDTVLLTLATAQAILYGVMTFWSRWFAYEVPNEQRPLLLMLGLFTICFVMHLVSLKMALQIDSPRRIVVLVLFVAMAFRGILLLSEPIQEVDIYRYLWDGAVSMAGVNPFRYSPEQVLAADSTGTLPDDLQRLVALRDHSAPMADILQRVHFAELTTVYPPVGQAVFAVASWLTPASATVQQRVIFMKAALLTFDLTTVILMLTLLRLAGLHLGWSILYAWSPLVLKEFANSGHLDAIAVCLTTAACTCWIYGLLTPGTSIATRWLALAGMLLGFGVAAKLYPIVVLPLVVIVALKRVSWRAAVYCALSALVTSALLLAPMLLSPSAAVPTQTSPVVFGPAANARNSLSRTSSVGETANTDPPRAGSGLATFLTRWEINDLIFMVILENVDPATCESEHVMARPIPWFAIVPWHIRDAVVAPLAFAFDETSTKVAFLLTRGMTLLVFLIAALWLAGHAQRSSAPARWLEAVFLTLAWFWALSPTLNPWYWTWVLPLLPFARGRAWFAVSGLVMFYYLRFWLTAHFNNFVLSGTGYRGEHFFHFVVVPVEHGIWLGWLVWESGSRRTWIRRSELSVSVAGSEVSTRVGLQPTSIDQGAHDGYG